MLNTTSKYPSKQCLLHSFAGYSISNSYMLLCCCCYVFVGFCLFVLFFIYYFATSALFNQAGLLVKLPVFLQKERLGIFRMNIEKTLPKEGDAVLGQHTEVLGVLTPWEVSRVGQWFPGCVTDTAINQPLRSSQPEPVQQQECSPCVKGHCCTKVMDKASKPGEVCRALPRKEQGVAQLPMPSKPALHDILLIRTWHGVYTVAICCAAREKGRSCEAFQGCVHPELANLLSPCLGACGGAAGCWHRGNHIKSSLTSFVGFFTTSNFLSRGRETT